jgi:hypothetical protein
MATCSCQLASLLMEQVQETAPRRHAKAQRARRPPADDGMQAEEKRQRTTRKPRPFPRPWTQYAPPRSAEDPAVHVPVSTFRFMSFNVLAGRKMPTSIARKERMSCILY